MFPQNKGPTFPHTAHHGTHHIRGHPNNMASLPPSYFFSNFIWTNWHDTALMKLACEESCLFRVQLWVHIHLATLSYLKLIICANMCAVRGCGMPAMKIVLRESMGVFSWVVLNLIDYWWEWALTCQVSSLKENYNSASSLFGWSSEILGQGDRLVSAWAWDLSY